MMRALAAAVLALLSLAPALGQPTPTRTSAPAAPTAAPSLTAAPSPTVAAPVPGGVVLPPSVPSAIVRFTGQLLDIRNGYVYFTTGDALKLADAPRITNYDTGQPTSVQPRAKLYAAATVDPTSHLVTGLAITKRRLPFAGDMAVLRPFIVVKSTVEPAPEIVGQKLTGRPVAVTFEVTAPPTTSFTDTLYISTDQSQWNAQAIKLDRVDAYKYRAQRTFASGTRFAYRVTRGTWNSVERGQDNLDPEPHQFFVREVDALAARVTVYHWSDENPSQQGVGPDSIPTPYNSNPFGGGPGGIAVPQRPTPAPTPPR